MLLLLSVLSIASTCFLKDFTMPNQLMNKNCISIFERNMNAYLKKKPTDCVLYSEEGAKFKAHKEMLIQTKFMRDVLASTNECD